ncbi:MAG: Sec-independent protein translocase protein TatC [Methanonatronarchaeales archaeon]|nr:Sec-independent protein translocase protein TatC [Methanonatronarchaeales archaeon]
MNDVQDALEKVDASLAIVRRRLTLLLALFIVLLVVLFSVAVDPLLLSVKGHVLSRVEGVDIIQWTPTEFLIYKVKVSAVLALLALSPLIAWYVREGVKQNLDVEAELNLGTGGKLLIVLTAAALFFGGIFYAYLLMMPIMFKFLVLLTPSDYAITYHMSGFYNFVALLVLAFGVVFELPLALNLAVRSGIVSYQQLAARRREAYVAVVAVGASLTPPDIVSQAIMATPLILFYELSLFTLRVTGSASSGEAPT